MHRIDHLLLERRLRSGGTSDLWLARRDGTPVVVKLLHAHLATDPRLRARMHNERTILERIDHSSVVRLLGAGEWEGRPYLVLERLSDTSLDRIRDQPVRASPEVVRMILIRLCEALGAAHAIGIVHRDVSPANVVVDGGLGVKLVDFGLARAPDLPDPIDPGAWLGSAAYAAPEQLEGRPVDGRADLFSVGVIAHELCSGRRLFWRGSNAATLLAVAETRVPLLGSPIDRVLGRALDRDPEARYPTALDLARALQGA
jgi:serine/threonine-protein kinase